MRNNVIAQISVPQYIKLRLNPNSYNMSITLNIGEDVFNFLMGKSLSSELQIPIINDGYEFAELFQKKGKYYLSYHREFSYSVPFGVAVGEMAKKLNLMKISIRKAKMFFLELEINELESVCWKI